MTDLLSVPPEVENISTTLEKAGFEAYLVGGCVRDALLGKSPKDWDITTNAKPEDIQSLFPDTYYNNEFGTVGVVNEEVADVTLKVVEVTPYRTESSYTNARHPDSVEFCTSLEEDLKRRDFTMNAIAYSVSKKELVDPHKGQKDISKKTIRAVGVAAERFNEDALRMLRAVRLATETGFSVSHETQDAIRDTAHLLEKIAKERIKDEFLKIINSPSPMMGINVSRETGLLPYMAPDLMRSVGVEQNGIHIYDVYEHLLRTVQHAADKDYTEEVRIAALFHDISKPETREWSDKTKDYTFHGHEVVGSRVTRNALKDLKFSKETIDKVSKLVRWHMFFSDPDQITLSAVRRMIRNVGGESNIWDLLDLRTCDRIGSGRPKEQPFRFRKYKALVEQALRDPLSVGMLEIDGSMLMDMGVPHGPRIGFTLNTLLEEVLEDASKNNANWLKTRANELSELSDTELKQLAEKGKDRLAREEKKIIDSINEKYWVN